MIIKTVPILDTTIWGNNVLNRRIHQCDENKGTHWLISFHPYGENQIVGENKSLKQLKLEMGNRLVKDEGLLRLAYLDAKEKLSIQCHPSNEYATKVSLNDAGKYEAWLILEAKPNAQLALGAYLTSTKALRNEIENNTLSDALRMVNVKAGDFVYIPAGCLHALGDGIIALEVSTSSNTTYRVYDYNRVDNDGKSRELHLKDAMGCVDLSIFPQVSQVVFEPFPSVLFDGEFFQIQTFEVDGTFEFEGQSHCWYGVCFDQLTIDEVIVNAYESFLISADSTIITFKGCGRVLLSRGK